MFPPALIIGMIYPVAMEIVVQNSPRNQAISMFGNAAALNTFGNILGVLVGAFLLLPWVGVLNSVQFLAAVSGLLGLGLLIFSSWRRRVWAWAAVMPVCVLFITQPMVLNYQALSSGANVYFSGSGWGEVIDHAESVDGGLTTVVKNQLPNGGKNVLTLLTNGKFQGNNAVKGEVQAQIGFALSPLLHTPKREQALVIGYGTGTTSRALNAAGFSHLDIVDLSKDVITLANRHFYDINDRVTEKAGVSTYITDGRNFLLLQNRQYDVIGLELTSIWFAGAASLYNQEFYQLAKRRLKLDGVLQQWVQLHHLEPLDMLHIIGSVRAEFRYVWLYEIGGQGMIIATNDLLRKPTIENANQLNSNANLTGLLQVYGQGAEALLNNILLTPSAIDKMLVSYDVPENYWVSTDDNLFLEYHTPRGNALNNEKSVAQNRAFFEKFKSM
jgi:spermidine synthase